VKDQYAGPKIARKNLRRVAAMPSTKKAREATEMSCLFFVCKYRHRRVKRNKQMFIIAMKYINTPYPGDLKAFVRGGASSGSGWKVMVFPGLDRKSSRNAKKSTLNTMKLSSSNASYDFHVGVPVQTHSVFTKDPNKMALHFVTVFRSL